jgi:amino-acid N-acetyltransferase
MNALEMLAFSGIRPGEAPEIMNILRQCDLPFEDITAEMLKNFIAARKGAAILGVAGLEISGGNALLRSVAVTEPNRGAGIGMKLVAAIERYARSRRVETLHLLTITAEAFFRKAGYAIIGRSKAPAAMQTSNEFTTLCPKTAVCMQKEISP